MEIVVDSFKTKAGTTLPFIQLKGKYYLEVKWRLVWFREEHPNWGIRTSLHTVNDNMCVAKAEIYDEKGFLIADAFKREDKTHFPDYIEKATTGAVGRALALVGYGTQFASELEEGERIVDAPVDRRQPQYSPQAATQRPVVPQPRGQLVKSVEEAGEYITAVTRYLGQ